MSSDSAALDELALAAGDLLRRGVTHAVGLGGSTRSLVARLTLADGSTAVAKQFLGAGAAYTAERTGLGLLANTPDVLAVDDELRLVVMTDAGTGPTLADLLLGDDAVAAREGATSWAAALGTLAGASRERVEEARAALPPHVDGWDAAAWLRDGLGAVTALTGGSPSGLDDAFAEVAALLEPSEADVVWPSDTCPDNAVRTPSGWVFLDLEGTTVSHAALVAAYPALPFPTCWCVAAPPAGFTRAMTGAFTTAYAAFAPDVTSRAAWPREVALASTAWVLGMSGSLLPRALAGGEESEAAGSGGEGSGGEDSGGEDSGGEGSGGAGAVPRLHPAAPTRRRYLAARWRWLAESMREVAPPLAAVGADASRWAEASWRAQDVAELDGYPAFQARD